MRRLLERDVYFNLTETLLAYILSQEIKKIKERYPYFELDIEQDAVRKPLLVKHEES